MARRVAAGGGPGPPPQARGSRRVGPVSGDRPGGLRERGLGGAIGRGTVRGGPRLMAVQPAEATAVMRVALVYDIDACRGPTGVTRHALAQLDGLRHRPGIDLRLVSGRLTEPDGLAFWESLDGLTRRELPLRTRNA